MFALNYECTCWLHWVLKIMPMSYMHQLVWNRFLRAVYDSMLWISIALLASSCSIGASKWVLWLRSHAMLAKCSSALHLCTFTADTLFRCCLPPPQFTRPRATVELGRNLAEGDCSEIQGTVISCSWLRNVFLRLLVGCRFLISRKCHVQMDKVEVFKRGLRYERDLWHLIQMRMASGFLIVLLGFN